MKVTLLIGPPGSGKTRWAREARMREMFNEEIDQSLVDRDEHVAMSVHSLEEADQLKRRLYSMGLLVCHVLIFEGTHDKREQARRDVMNRLQASRMIDYAELSLEDAHDAVEVFLKALGYDDVSDLFEHIRRVRLPQILAKRVENRS